jgi:hypothetical protein
VKIEPDMAWIVAQIREKFPAATIDDPGPSRGGGWLVDVQLGDRRVVLQRTKIHRFGVSLVHSDEPYGLSPDKTYIRAAAALLRVRQLFDPYRMPPRQTKHVVPIHAVARMLGWSTARVRGVDDILRPLRLADGSRLYDVDRVLFLVYTLDSCP